MKKITVDCEYNDPVDIKCGGPRILGYDFFVNDKNVKLTKKKIEIFLKKYNQPLINISISDAPDNAKHWSLGEIEICIKEGY